MSCAPGGATERGETQLARDHSLLLEERLRAGAHGPTSFAGLLGGQGSRLNEYAFLGPDEDEAGALVGQRPLQRWVSSINRVLPSGEKAEPRGKVEIAMLPPAARQPEARQPPKQARLSGAFAPQQHAPQQRQAQPVQQQAQQQRKAASPQPPPMSALAMPVPGNPLKIRLKITNRGGGSREGSADRVSPPAAAAAATHLLQSVRQLGGGSAPLLSPIPSGWADVVSTSGTQAPAPAAAPPAAGAPPRRESAAPEERQAVAAAPPGPTVQQEARRGSVGGSAAALTQQQSLPDAAARTAAAAAAPAAATGAKRPAAAPASEGAGGTAKRPKAAAVPEPAPLHCGTPSSPRDGNAPQSAPESVDVQMQEPPGSGASHPLARGHSSSMAAAVQQAQAQQRAAQAQQHAAQQRLRSRTPDATAAPAPAAGAPAWAAEALASRSDGSRLGGVAALLPEAVALAGGSGELPAPKMVSALQEEGKKLKKFAEKKTREGRPTHVSSMFLCQSCVKFLTVAAIMEAHPAKFSRENTSSMYSQTATLLDSCAHSAARAEGPAMITRALCLLAQRLAAVARMRAAYVLRSEGMQQVATFRSALEKASGETYQRPSPTDSNTSTSMSVPLGGGRREGSVGPAGSAGPRVGSPPGGRPRSAAAAAPDSQGPPLVGMPKPVLERQLLAAQHSQALLGALGAFAKSAERLREYMGEAATQNNVHGLKAAASVLLLSADAGVGPAPGILSLAKVALDSVMQMQ